MYLYHDVSFHSEEIDNPRMRGRKLVTLSKVRARVSEEIDNPRMRGRKLNVTFTELRCYKKKLIIPG